MAAGTNGEVAINEERQDYEGRHGNEGRQGLRPWIIARVNSGSIEGLGWCDEEKTVFQIPWTHKGKQEWNEQTGRIFLEYEKHTGRYQEGSVKPFNYSDSKQRLRSALGKSNDFRYIKDLDRPDVRMYRVVPRTPPRQLIHEQPADPFRQSDVWHSLQIREALIPACVDEYIAVSGGSEPPLSSDLQNISTSDMLPAAPASGEPMIVSIDTDIEMLSKSMGSMEISGGGSRPVRKILIENGDCSAVMCQNSHPRDNLGSSHVNTVIGGEECDLRYQLDQSQIDILINQSSSGESDAPAFQPIPISHETEPYAHRGEAQSEAFSECDTWIDAYNDVYNTDGIPPAATSHENPSASSYPWDGADTQNYAEESNTDEWTPTDLEREEWTSSDYERLAKELFPVRA